MGAKIELLLSMLFALVDIPLLLSLKFNVLLFSTSLKRSALGCGGRGRRGEGGGRRAGWVVRGKRGMWGSEVMKMNTAGPEMIDLLAVST